MGLASSEDCRTVPGDEKERQGHSTIAVLSAKSSLEPNARFSTKLRAFNTRKPFQFLLISSLQISRGEKAHSRRGSGKF